MKIAVPVRFRDLLCGLAWLFCATATLAQDSTAYKAPEAPSDFWRHVQFGGGLGVGIGNGYTDFSISPGAIYNFNRYFAAGVSLTGSYARYRDYSPTVDEYKSWIYGGSIVGLFMPIPQVQLSAELEELRVNSQLETVFDGTVHDDFWNTGLFLGVGYRSQNVTVGVRYNVLHDSGKTVYADAFMPFVRAYF